MKKNKKIVLSMIAKIGKNSAIKSAGAASTFNYHQPVEPKNIKSMLKK